MLCPAKTVWYSVQHMGWELESMLCGPSSQLVTACPSCDSVRSSMTCSARLAPCRSPSRKRNFPKSTKKALFQVALGSISQSAGSDSDDLSDAPDFATLQSAGRPPELQRQAATHRLSSKGATAATSAISTPNSSSSSAGLPYRAIPVSSKPHATPSLLPPPAAVSKQRAHGARAMGRE